MLQSTNLSSQTLMQGQGWNTSHAPGKHQGCPLCHILFPQITLLGGSPETQALMPIQWCCLLNTKLVRIPWKKQHPTSTYQFLTLEDLTGHGEEQWEEVNLITKLTLKDWPEEWYTGEMCKVTGSKCGQREQMFKEFVRYMPIWNPFFQIAQTRIGTSDWDRAPTDS